MSRHPNSKPFRTLGSRQGAAVPVATTSKQKEALRAKIEADIEDFVARGGAINDADVKPAPARTPGRKNRMGRNW